MTPSGEHATPGSLPYVFGTGDAELDRLVTQASVLAPYSGPVLERAAVPREGRAIDLGCGCLGVLDLLAARVGPDGTVVGLDREPRMLEVARDQLARRGLRNVELVQADAAATGLPSDAFDLVHCRAILCNSPHTNAILAEMVRLARPGATVAAGEPDLSEWYCEPSCPEWDALMATFQRVVAEAGTDLAYGRRLSRRMRAAGLQDVDLRVDELTTDPGHPYQMLLPVLVGNVRAAAVSLNLRSATEFDELMAGARIHLERAGTTTGGVMFWQAWGRKPGSR